MNTTPPESPVQNPKLSAAHKWSIGKKIIAGLGLLFVGFVLYQTFFYLNPHARANFATFKPGSTNITNQELALFTPRTKLFGHWVDTIVSPNVRIELTIPSKQLFVLQQKNKNFSYDCKPEFARKSCEIKHTPGGQQYLFAVDAPSEPKNHVEQRAKFIKDGTLITIATSKSTDTPMPESDWNQLIDSFTKADFKDLPVRRYHPGP